MFSATVRASRVEELRAELAQKQEEARQLDHRYRQVALCAEPVTAARSTVELTEAVVAEPDRQRRRFNAAYLKSLVHRDRPTDVRALVQNRLYLLDEDVHRGMTAREYALSLGRSGVQAVLDEVARGVVEKGTSED